MTSEAVASTAAVVADGPAGAVFYRLDSTRVTMREYAFGSKNPLSLGIAGLLKVLRVRLPGSSDDPAVERLEPFEVAGAEGMPEEVQAWMEGEVRGLEALGFVGPGVWHVIDDVLHATKTYMVSLRHGDGSAVGRVHVRAWAIRQPPKVVKFVEFVTALEGGGYVWSLSSKADMIGPGECVVVRKENAPAGELWGMHRGAVAKVGREVVRVGDEGKLREVVEGHHGAVTRFHLGRGVFAARTEADRKRVEARLKTRAVAAAGGLPDADVLAEVERLQNKKSSWWNALIILGVSLLVFLGAGLGPSDGIGSGWDVMAMIVGILFFHELGHYVAMRAFGYQNLKMFFIPFFGAAVSGRHYNVAGWKKVIVSLMGPVPGIVLGAVIGMVGIVLHKEGMAKVGVMALILNGFNLLPVLPLDGGWVAHVLIFSRNYVLDAAFRVVAAGAMIAGGMYVDTKILMYLGIFALIALPATIKVARVVADLRKAGVRAASEDDQTIPPETAQVIVTRLRQAFPKGASTKVLAQHTVSVFETLNARPPGWWATIGLGAAHVGSFVAALVLAGVLVVAQRPDFGAGLLRSRLGTTPTHAVAAKEVRTWPEEAGAVPAAGARRVVVATFKSAGEAAAMFDLARSSLPAGAAMRLFGQTVMVAVPDGDDGARRGVLRLMQGRTKSVFVANEETGSAFMLTCEAPDEATATRLAAEAEGYFSASAAMHLIAPWAGEDERSPEERARHEVARRTYARLTSAGGGMFDDPQIKELSRKAIQATREGDRAEVKRIAAERMRMIEERRGRAIREIRAEGEGKVDVGLIDLYVEWLKPTTRPAGGADVSEEEELDYDEAHYEKLSKAIGPRMGQLPLTAEGKVVPAADAETARFGGTDRRGKRLSFEYVRLVDPFDGAPAMVRWLDAAGCGEIKYKFPGGEVMEESGEE